jgi:GNAT superfamily N-acetyltransferase
MKIFKINPFVQSQLVEAIALVYQQSFGGEPWNEGFICPVCQSIFALASEFRICPECIKKEMQINLVKYWPKSKVLSDFYVEMQKPEAICVVAQVDGVVIGFAWGYKVCASQDLGIHLEAPGLHQSLEGEFFYLDECAVSPAYQNNGVGKKLTEYIFQRQKQKYVLARTLKGSQMSSLLINCGGKIIQKISRNRVIIQITF